MEGTAPVKELTPEERQKAIEEEEDAQFEQMLAAY